MNANVERYTYSLDEAAAASGVSRATLYRMMDRGELRSVKLCKRRLIPVAELKRLCGIAHTGTEATAA